MPLTPPFARWEDVEEWTGASGGWRGRRLVFAGNWVLHMTVERGFRWAHRHPQSQVLWLASGELLARVGDPERPAEVREHVLRPGDLLLLGPHVFHDMTALTDCEAWETRGMEGPDEWEAFSVRVAHDAEQRA